MMWGGAFSAAPEECLRRLNDSLKFDKELIEEDVRGSVAWAGELLAAKILSTTEHSKIVRGLMEILDEAKKQGIPNDGHEDVHSFVEGRLGEKIGAAAGKLHTGRSRNDQVATDLKLYLKKSFCEAIDGGIQLACELGKISQAEAKTPMPGYTHLRRAIPVTFGHWCMAYAEMLLRDISRFKDAAARADECPLGSGALAGTPLEIDRSRLAKTLGFARPTSNSLDAVSDRDAAVEYLFCASLMLTHLSRMAEDLILFSSDEFHFISLPDSLSTGSSRMPHKKNPDLLELIRGHAARATGDLTGLLAILKGLPLSYNKDLQLDKEAVFRMRETLLAVLPALCSLVKKMEPNRSEMLKAATDERMLATDLADAMVSRGVPFRKAHEVVGARVKIAAGKGVKISDLGAGCGVTTEDLKAMDVERALSRRRASGGTSPQRVMEAADELKKLMAKMRKNK